MSSEVFALLEGTTWDTGVSQSAMRWVPSDGEDVQARVEEHRVPLVGVVESAEQRGNAGA